MKQARADSLVEGQTFKAEGEWFTVSLAEERDEQITVTAVHAKTGDVVDTFLYWPEELLEMWGI